MLPRTFIPRVLALGAAFVAALSVAGCGLDSQPPDVGTFDGGERARRESQGLLFGPEGLSVSNRPRENEGGGGGGIGVNAFLWRASLDTIDFMPLASADPFGGVIITDWYAPPASPDERLKVNVFILDTQLRADGVKAAVFRQIRSNNGDWQDVPVEAGVARQIEDTILTRARELRIAAG
jgi:hypothetical protein